MTPILAFDIETVPDIEGLKALHGLDSSVTAADVAAMAFQQRRQVTGNDFLQHHLHRVIAISCALRERDSFRVWSLGEMADTEADLIQRFYDGISKYSPQLVSWNGSGFDLPVLHYRGLIHGVHATRYWELGDDDKEFRWNNYISRYHMRHVDLMDLLALYQPRSGVPLDEIAQLMGFPGKIGMSGSKVWDAYQEGKLAEIRSYCEADTVNTYLVYLRFQFMRGALSDKHYLQECGLVRETLSQSQDAHWKEFVSKWRKR